MGIANGISQKERENIMAKEEKNQRIVLPVGWVVKDGVVVAIGRSEMYVKLPNKKPKIEPVG